MTLFLSLLLLVLCLSYSFFLIGIMWGALFGAPYVPSNAKTVERMLEFAEIKPNDVVYDLGSGDGRLVFAAAKTARSAIGYEISYPIFLLSKLKQYFFRHKGKIHNRSFLKTKLHDADVIFCYLLDPTMKKLQEKFIKELKSGTRIICHGFKIPGWTAIKHLPMDKKTRSGTVWMYVVQ